MEDDYGEMRNDCPANTLVNRIQRILSTSQLIFLTPHLCNNPLLKPIYHEFLRIQFHAMQAKWPSANDWSEDWFLLWVYRSFKASQICRPGNYKILKEITETVSKLRNFTACPIDKIFQTEVKYCAQRFKLPMKNCALCLQSERW